jgi:hypothetical protein
MKAEIIKEELSHIKNPFTYEQILDLYIRGDYATEFLLQHCILNLIQVNEGQKDNTNVMNSSVLQLIEKLRNL